MVKLLIQKTQRKVQILVLKIINFMVIQGVIVFFGSYQTKADTLQIEGDRVASTQMLCHPMDVMDFENSFLSNFKGIFKISNENGKLVLSNDEMKIFF